jgi:hypothetical protein
LKQPFEPVDLNRIKTIHLAKRNSRSSFSDLAKIPSAAGAKQFFESLPGFLKANDLRDLIEKIISARRRRKPVIVMAGGHVIKVGLSPILIDLIKSDLITGLCFNGAGLIHDAEMALVGKTSEDVAAGLVDGSFGMSSETAAFFAEAASYADAHGIGLGESAGQILDSRRAPYRRWSLMHTCYRKDIPMMIHIAVDTDIVCQHPNYNAAQAAQASHHDFKILAREISKGENGGVFINLGSAVILPEVFLKALTVSRNIYGRPHKIVTANFDMISHYRPAVNVVERPTRDRGVGYNFVGHHEIMIPLLAWGLKAFSKKKSPKTAIKKRS